MINIHTELMQLVPSVINPDEFFVLLCIAKRINVDRAAWPSQELLMKETGFSPSKIYRDIKSLTDKGLIEKQQRYNKMGQFSSNIYTLKVSGLGVYIPAFNQQLVEINETEAVGQNDMTSVGQNDMTSVGQNDMTSVGQNDMTKYCTTTEVLNIKNSSSTEPTLEKIEELKTEAKSHPLYPSIDRKMREKNLNDVEIEDELTFACHKYLLENKTSNLIQFLSSWSQNLKYQWKPQKANWQKAKELEETYQANSEPQGTLVDLFQYEDETNEQFENRAEERAKMTGSKYRLRYREKPPDGKPQELINKARKQMFKPV